jgi:hypothetical protein
MTNHDERYDELLRAYLTEPDSAKSDAILADVLEAGRRVDATPDSVTTPLTELEDFRRLVSRYLTHPDPAKAHAMLPEIATALTAVVAVGEAVSVTVATNPADRLPVTMRRAELEDIRKMLLENGRSGPLRDEIAQLLHEVGHEGRIVVKDCGGRDGRWCAAMNQENAEATQ